MDKETFNGLYIPVSETRMEVVCTVHLDKNVDLKHAIKLACQLVELLCLNLESNDLSYAIFGDKLLIARQVAHLDFDFQNLAMN